MHIAVYHDLPSGGAKRSTYEMVRRLAQCHTVEVFTLSTANHDFCDLRPIVKRYSITEFEPLPLFKSPWGRLNQLQRWRTLGHLEHVSKNIADQIDAARPDVVLVHPSMWSQAPSVLNFVQTPTVYYVHEPLRSFYEPDISRPSQNRGWRSAIDNVDPLIHLYQRRLQHIDYRNTLRASRLLTNSTFTAENIARFYHRQSEVCYLGVDTLRFHPMGNVEREKFVLSVGALRPNKGFDFLIDALATIPPNMRPPLHIVANSNDILERQFLLQKARTSDVKVNIETDVSEDSLLNLYNRALIVVYAPVNEPFGLVPLEAMAFGTPIVGVNEGGVAETILDGITGRLIPRDASTFGKAVQLLLENDDLRDQYGRQAREYVLSTWGWDKSVARIAKHLEQAANAGPN